MPPTDPLLDEIDALLGGRSPRAGTATPPTPSRVRPPASDYRGLTRQIAEEEGIDPDLFERLIQRESNFNPSAVSPKGAYGLGQLMPDTAKDLGVDARDPEQNLRGSARYLRQQLKAFGRTSEALAAYNAGPQRVREFGGIPPFRETQEYVDDILGDDPDDAYDPDQLPEPRTPADATSGKAFQPASGSDPLLDEIDSLLKPAARAPRGQQSVPFEPKSGKPFLQRTRNNDIDLPAAPDALRGPKAYPPVDDGRDLMVGSHPSAAARDNVEARRLVAGTPMERPPLAPPAPVASHRPDNPTAGERMLRPIVGERAAALPGIALESMMSGMVSPAKGLIKLGVDAGILDESAYTKLKAGSEALVADIPQMPHILDDPRGTLASPEWWASGGGQVIGSVAALYGAGVIGGKPLAVVGESWMEASGAYDEAREKGASPEQAGATAAAVFIANLPTLWFSDSPIFSEPTKRAIANVFIRAGVEGAQEGVQNVYQSAAAKAIYDPERAIIDKGTLDEAALGAIVGPAAGALIDGSAGRAVGAAVRKARDLGQAVRDRFGRTIEAEVVTPPVAAPGAETPPETPPEHHQNTTGTPPATPPVAPAGPASVPFMVTKAMEAELRTRGYDDRAINAMTPEEARTILASAVAPAAAPSAPSAPTSTPQEVRPPAEPAPTAADPLLDEIDEILGTTPAVETPAAPAPASEGTEDARPLAEREPWELTTQQFYEHQPQAATRVGKDSILRLSPQAIVDESLDHYSKQDLQSLAIVAGSKSKSGTKADIIARIKSTVRARIEVSNATRESLTPLKNEQLLDLAEALGGTRPTYLNKYGLVSTVLQAREQGRTNGKYSLAEANHLGAVQRAVTEGKPVPAHVLKHWERYLDTWKGPQEQAAQPPAEPAPVDAPAAPKTKAQEIVERVAARLRAAGHVIEPQAPEDPQDFEGTADEFEEFRRSGLPGDEADTPAPKTFPGRLDDDAEETYFGQQAERFATVDHLSANRHTKPLELKLAKKVYEQGYADYAAAGGDAARLRREVETGDYAEDGDPFIAKQQADRTTAAPTARPQHGEPLDPADLERMAPEDIFPKDTKPVLAKDLDGGKRVTPKEADAILDSWKAEADRVAREEDHSNEVVFSLFDRTGAWSEPYRRAGYDVRTYDIRNGDDLLKFFPVADITEAVEEGKTIVGVLAAPPCTSFAVSGNAWWEDQHAKADVEMVERKYGFFASKYFDTPLEYAQTLVHAAELFIELANPSQFHALENPVSRIQKLAGLPDPLLRFNPFDFGDPYTKKTQLWGVFDPQLPTARVEPTEGSFIHKLRGDDQDQKDLRSVTPEGFAYAFFMANHQAPEAGAAAARTETLPPWAPEGQEPRTGKPKGWTDLPIEDGSMWARFADEMHEDQPRFAIYTADPRIHIERLTEAFIRAQAPGDLTALREAFRKYYERADEDQRSSEFGWNQAQVDRVRRWLAEDQEEAEAPAETPEAIRRRKDARDAEVEESARPRGGPADGRLLDALTQAKHVVQVKDFNDGRIYVVSRLKDGTKTSTSIKRVRDGSYASDGSFRPKYLMDPIRAAVKAAGHKWSDRDDHTGELTPEAETGPTVIPGLKQVAISMGAAADQYEPGDSVLYKGESYTVATPPKAGDRLRITRGGEGLTREVDARKLDEPAAPEAPGAPRPEQIRPTWMNVSEIDEAVERFDKHPVLGPAARFLKAFQEQVDSHSDGWPYWKQPGQSAGRLMGLLHAHLRGGMGAYPKLPAPTVADVQATMAPIKAFMTRRGAKAGITLPPLELGQAKADTPAAPEQKYVLPSFVTHHQRKAQAALPSEGVIERALKADHKRGDMADAVPAAPPAGVDPIAYYDRFISVAASLKDNVSERMGRMRRGTRTTENDPAYVEASLLYKAYERVIDTAFNRLPKDEQTRRLAKLDADTEPEPTAPKGVPFTWFRSGVARTPADFDGLAENKVPIGVTATGMSDEIRKRVIAYLNAGGKVFVDSGAFGTANPKFDSILALYRQLALNATPPNRKNLTVVAPDVAPTHGHADPQSATIDLLRQHQKTIKELMAKGMGVHVIVPAQQGQRTLADLERRYLGLFGPDFILGVAFNKGAWSQESIIEAVNQSSRPVVRLHLLGGGENRAAVQRLLAALAETGKKVDVSGDSDAIRAKTGEGRAITEDTREQLEDAADSIVEDDPGFDETEIAGEIGRGNNPFTDGELETFAEALGGNWTPASVKRTIEAKTFWKQLEQSGLPDDVAMHAINRVVKARTTTAARPAVRTQAVKDATAPKPEAPAVPNADLHARKAANEKKREEIRKRLMKRHGSQLNVGIDPQDLQDLVELTVTYVDDGITEFRLAWRQFKVDMPKLAAKLGMAFEMAWEEATGETASVADAEAAADNEGEETADATVDGGGDAGAGDGGEPAGGPGIGRPADLEGEQPEDSGAPSQPGRKGGRRGSRAGRGARGARGGDAAPGAGDGDARGAGVHAPEHVDTADVEADPDVAAAHAKGEAPRHFVIDATETVTSGGPAQKLANNLAALRLLKELAEDGGRMASDAEQAILAKYIGWGHTALAKIVDPRPEVVAELEGRDKQAREELERLLTPAELKSLGDSTINAHYSFNDLPRAMWRLVQQLGFAGGAVLEPAIGTGHFFGTMPGDVVAHPRTRLFGVDMEPIAAAIAKQLYQGAFVQASPLQEARLPDNYFDLILSNVPFGRVQVFDPSFVSAAKTVMTKAVHNYYFGKAIDQARPGGLIVFVTSRFTMDSKTDVVRNYIAERADFLGAFRLPSGAFGKTAGTEVVTDVIVLRKKDGTTVQSPAWTGTEEVRLSDAHYRSEVFAVNEYYAKHPDQILGTQDATGKMNKRHGDDLEYNVTGELTPALLAQALRGLPTDVYQESATPPRELAAETAYDAKQGSYILEKGKLFTFDKGTLVPSTLKGKALERAKGFLPLRDAYQRVLDVMTAAGDDAALAKAQKALTSTYDTFVEQFGRVNARVNSYVIDADPNGSRILALEDVEWVKHQKGRPATLEFKGLADIFTKRTVVPIQEPTSADSAQDALVQSLAWKGRIDMPYMTGLTGKTETQLAAALGDDIFTDPVSKTWVAAEDYLSGDVVSKLAQAQAAATERPEMQRNVDALLKVQPTPLTTDDFSAPFGATWIPLDVYEQFLKATGGSAAVTVTRTNNAVRTSYAVEGGGRHEHKPDGTSYEAWVTAGLNGELPNVYGVDADGNRFVDTEATQQYRESLKQLRESFNNYWRGELDVSEKLTGIYNAMFNREAAREFDGSRIVIPNASPAISLRRWQKNVIWRALQAGNTLLAHAVGAGKTYALIAITGEMKRLGLARKPMIVVPNHLIEQWRRDFLTYYPAARVLVPNKAEYDKKNRKRLIARMASNDWDAVIVPQSQFLRISVKPATLQAFVAEQEALLLAEGADQMNITVEDFDELVTGKAAGEKRASKALGGRNVEQSTKDIVRALINLRTRMQRRLDQQAKDSPIEFDELGVDALLVDEAHLFKNLYFSTGKNKIVGLRGSDAARAMDMFLKVRMINDQSNGRNVHFATGTPISNAVSELYTMFRYLAQPTLDRLGMAGFDSWANNYAEAEAAMEPAPGGGYTEKMRLRNWSNLRELSKLFRRFSDVITSEDLQKATNEDGTPVLKLPKLKNGKPTVVALDPHPQMGEFMDSLNARIEAIKGGDVDPKDDNHLKITSEASLAAIDLPLVWQSAGEDPNSRLRVAAREIYSRFTASTPTRGAQVVFLDVGTPKGKDIPPLPADLAAASQAQIAAVEAASMEADEAEDADDDAGDDDVVNQEQEAVEAMGEVERMSQRFGPRSLYVELKDHLVKQGIPANQIAFIHQAQTPAEQARLFKAINDGRIRVLLATTAKGATGMNIQKRLVALHHLDVPWRPADMEQREGRILRQGNENDEVEVIRYVTMKSFDEYRWGLLATKQGFIYKLLKGDINTMEDVDPSQLDMQTAAALASGDPRTLKMLNLEREVKALGSRYANWYRNRQGAIRSQEWARNVIERAEEASRSLEAIEAQSKAWAEGEKTVTLTREVGQYLGMVTRKTPANFDFRDNAAREAFQTEIEHLMRAAPKMSGREPLVIGTAGPYVIKYNRSFERSGTPKDEKAGRSIRFYEPYLSIEAGPHQIGSTKGWNAAQGELLDYGDEPAPDYVRSLTAFFSPTRLTTSIGYEQDRIRKAREEIAASKVQLTKPFTQEAALKEKERELKELRIALGIEQRLQSPEEREAEAFARQILQAELDGNHDEATALWAKVEGKNLTDRVRAAIVTIRDAEKALQAGMAFPDPEDVEEWEGEGGTAASKSSGGTGNKTRLHTAPIPSATVPAGTLPTAGTTVRAIEYPELVELVEALVGAPPYIVKAFRGDPKHGTFGGGRVTLLAGLFKRGREAQLLATIAHEIGHAVDWLPHQIMKRGNLLGRLRSLYHYLQHTFTVPGGNVIRLDVVRDELKALSQMWRPWDPATASTAERTYRNSSRELYADAISVLLNDPALLKREAPTFYREFFAGLTEKPDVRDAYDEMQVVMAATPEERIARRSVRDREMVDRGDVAAKAAAEKKDKDKEDSKRSLWEKYRAELVDKNVGLQDLLREAEKQGRVIPEDEDPRLLLSQLNWLGIQIEGFIGNNYEPIKRALQTAGVAWQDFGNILFYERIMAGDRKHLPNPHGYGPKEAAELHTHTMKRHTPAQRTVINAQIDAFRKVTDDVADEAYEAGLYTDEFHQERQQAFGYATFRVIDKIIEGDEVSSRIYQMVGTHAEVQNVADATILKTLVTMRALHRNRAKLAVWKELELADPKGIQQAKEVGHGRTKKILPPRMPGWGLVIYMEKGKVRGKYVGEHIADGVNNLTIGKGLATVELFKLANTYWFRPVFTALNLRFQSRNLWRDFQRTWFTTPGMTIGRLLRRYGQGHAIARAHAFGPKKARLTPGGPKVPNFDDPGFRDLLDAKEAGILGLTFNAMADGRDHSDLQVDDIMRQARMPGYELPPTYTGPAFPRIQKKFPRAHGAISRVAHPMLHPLAAPALKVIKSVEQWGNYIEALPKTATLMEFKGSGAIADITPKQRAFIRERVGTGDILAGGTVKPLTNELFIFSNVMVQSTRADFVAITNPATRSDAIWKVMMTTVLPKVITGSLVAAGVRGLLGDDDDDDTDWLAPLRWAYKSLRGASEYDFTNHILIPLGVDKDGKSAYFKWPQDQFNQMIGGLVWKLMHLLDGETHVRKMTEQVLLYAVGRAPGATPPIKVAGDLVDYATGRNIYDPYRNNLVMTREDMDAADAEGPHGDAARWQLRRKFLGYEMQQVGMGLLSRFVAGDSPYPRSVPYQWVLDWTPAGAFIKVTDYGRLERLRRSVIHNQTATAAATNKAERAAINDAIDELKARGDTGQGAVNSKAHRILNDLYRDASRETRNRQLADIKRKLEVGVQVGEVDLLTEAVMGLSNDAKVAAIRDGLKDRTRSEQRLWLNRAVRAHVISEKVRTEALR